MSPVFSRYAHSPIVDTEKIQVTHGIFHCVPLDSFEQLVWLVKGLGIAWPGLIAGSGFLASIDLGIDIVIFLKHFCPRGKGAMRSILRKAATRKTRPDNNTVNSMPYSFW